MGEGNVMGKGKGRVSRGGISRCTYSARKSVYERIPSSQDILTLDGRNSLSTRNDRSEDVALHGDTEGKRDDIEEEKVGGVGGGGLSRKDTSLDGGTVGNSLIGVDALLELLAVEEVAEELLYPRNTGGATNKHNLVNLALLKTRVLQDLLNWLDGAVESLAVDVLETSTGNVGVEVLAIEERVDLNGGLGTVGESTLRALTGGTQTTEGTWVSRHV